MIEVFSPFQEECRIHLLLKPEKMDLNKELPDWEFAIASWKSLLETGQARELRELDVHLQDVAGYCQRLVFLRHGCVDTHI